jgi:predicted transcriptional regulator
VGTRNKWQHTLGFVFIALMAISFFNLVGSGPLNTSSQLINTDDGNFPLNVGISYGTRLLHTSRDIMKGEVASHSLISVIPLNIYNSRLFTGLSFDFNHITEFALMALGSLTIQLYKSLQSKEQKEWAKNRLLIRTEISFNPGISLRGLSRTTGLAIGSTQYWLRILEQNNEIDIFSFGRSKHYFIREQQLSFEEKLLFALKQNKRILEILQSLHENPDIQTQKDLCTRLGYNKSLLSYYVKILKNHHVIDSELKHLSISEDFQSFLN